MAEGRMIKKRISKSEKFAALKTDSARLLYCLIMPHTDVKGRTEADPVVIKGNVVPYIASFRLRKIQSCLEYLHEVGLIKLYKVNNIQYLQIERFDDFNRVDPSKEADSEIPPAPLQSNSGEGPAEVKVKVKVKDKVYIVTHPPSICLTKEAEDKLIEDYGKLVIKDYIENLNLYSKTNPKRFKQYVDHAAVIRTWLKKDNKPKIIKAEPPKVKEELRFDPNVSKLIHDTKDKIGKK